MYDTAFYDLIRGGVKDSAARVVPILYGLYEPKTVVDVGCGEGWWAAEFAERGCDVLGVDGDYVRSGPLGDRFLPADLTMPLAVGRTFDLALSLEVAEHLPPERAAGFVDDLCELAPVVVFSAAIPGQGGVGHINEQWPHYWAAHFERNGYTVSGALRFRIWNDGLVENWYRQNLLIASRDATPAELFAGPAAAPLPLVHPVLFQHRVRR